MLKPTAIFFSLAPAVQEQLLETFYHRVGRAIVNEVFDVLVLPDPKDVSKVEDENQTLFAEWLSQTLFGGSHVDVRVRFEAARSVGGYDVDCPNCGSDGSYRECGSCGGRSYLLSGGVSECRVCRITETITKPTIRPFADGSEKFPF